MSIAAILLYTAPVMVMLVSCLLFGERFTKRKLAALLSAFAGCIFVSLGSDAKVTPAGFIFGLLAGAAYASYSIFGKLALDRGYSSYTVSAYAFIVAAVFSLIFGKPAEIAYRLGELGYKPEIFLLIATCALVTAFLPFLLYTKGLASTPAGRAAIMASAEPLSATVCGLFEGEQITVSALCGIIGILFAIVILNTSKAEQEKLRIN
ncbi:MAG: DMT family transporter, partial [Clostridia bacterium]|nr:DMT family transporter [Clostridia bacterium]